MSGNFAIKGGGGGGVGRLMANAILNFHFDYLHTSLRYDAGIRPDYDGPPTEVEVNLAIRSVK